MSGYLKEIGDLHSLHLALKNIKDKTGINSSGDKTWLHFGQWDRPCTIDSPFGTRYMTTFKNDPKIVPSDKNTIE